MKTRALPCLTVTEISYFFDKVENYRRFCSTLRTVSVIFFNWFPKMEDLQMQLQLYSSTVHEMMISCKFINSKGQIYADIIGTQHKTTFSPCCADAKRHMHTIARFLVSVLLPHAMPSSFLSSYGWGCGHG